MRISKIAVLCAMVAAGAAQAQTADISVKGKIAPPACTASFIGGGNLDWGTVSHNELSETNTTILSEKEVTLQVQCSEGQKTHIAFWATDPNKASALPGQKIPGYTNWDNGNAADRIFGLGMDPVTGKKLGNFTMISKSSAFDGTEQKTKFGYTRDMTGATNTFTLSDFGWGYMWNEQWTVLGADNAKPAAANTFTFTFGVYPQLNKKTEITGTQEVPFAGTAQFNVRYF